MKVMKHGRDMVELTPSTSAMWPFVNIRSSLVIIIIMWYGTVGFNAPLDTFRSFRRRFYWSDDPTNSVIALKDNSLPGQGPIPQAQHTKR